MKGALWVGEHHNSIQDHLLQARLIRDISERRTSRLPMAVGLEQVQVKFQPFLDAYIENSISLGDLRRLVEWDKRWSWPFEAYEPIFQTARDCGVGLIALNVNTEDLSLVEQGGYPRLPRATLNQYIADP